MAREGGQILETFTLQCHDRPEMKAFRKTPSKFASKNTKMAKNRGSFLGTFTNELLFHHHMQCLKLPPEPLKLSSGSDLGYPPPAPHLRPLCALACSTQWSRRGVLGIFLEIEFPLLLDSLDPY